MYVAGEGEEVRERMRERGGGCGLVDANIHSDKKATLSEVDQAAEAPTELLSPQAASSHPRGQVG